MVSLQPKLNLRVSQKQILTPGLVQMVTVLQLNRLELKEMINQEIVNNPVLEEATEDGAEEVAAVFDGPPQPEKNAGTATTPAAPNAARRNCRRFLRTWTGLLGKVESQV